MDLSQFKFHEILILLIIILLGIFIVLGGIIFIINRIIKKGFKLKGKNGLIEIGEEDTNFSSIIFLIIERITSITTEKDKIKFISILKKQMNYTELRLLKIKGLLQSQYLKTLSEKQQNKINLTSDEDYQYYSVLLDISFRGCRSILRSAFKENNLPDYNENQNNWSKYIQDKIDAIMQKHTDFLNKMYIGNDKIISREEIHDFTFKKENYEQITTIINEIFKEALLLKRTYQEKLNELDNELKLFFESYLKKDN